MSTAPVCVAVGLALMDICYHVRHLPQGGGKTFARSIEHHLGGVATNAARAMTALGAETRLYARLGDDDLAETILQKLDAEKIVWRGFVTRVAKAASPQSSVCIDQSGERAIVNYLDPELFSTPPSLPQALWCGAKALLCDMRWPQAVALALQEARKHAVFSVLDYDLAPHTGARALIAKADACIFSKPALLQLCATENIKQALTTVSRSAPYTQLAVTCGHDGVYFLDNNTTQHLPAYAIPTLNTLGAGDVFHGAFTWAIADGCSFTQALQLANAAAALRVSGQSAFPTQTKLLSFFNAQPVPS